MNNLVFNKNGSAFTNSLLVAEKFGKEHRTVIRSIRDLMGSAQNCAQLFIESSYPDSQPKAEYTEKVLTSTNTVSVTQIAKDYGLSGVSLNRKLNLMGVIYRVNNQWVLYKKHEGKGYTKSITYHDEHQRAYMRTEWTQKGRQFIDSLLR